MIPTLLATAAHGGDPLQTPALTVSLALAAGLICQAVAHHLRLPGIVLLLAAGAVLGPDVLNVVRPELLGDTLQTLVGFAVAVILFEGGMNLNLKRLRRESSSIRQLITTGALVTAAGSAFAAKLILGWDWRLAILFGTLVIVTGPTVITPLVRRIKLNTKLGTVLEAEGVLIDPIGAIVAVVALEVALQPAGSGLGSGILGVGARLGIGLLVGLGGGFLIAILLRLHRLIPDGLENVFTLSVVLALFHVSNALIEESGIAAVTMAGLVVGNVRTRALGDLLEFKEQLTVMLIALLFVLLSADVRFAEIQALGIPGLLTVVALMLVVRPLNILAGTVNSGLSVREKTFLAWMAPRGIVAAAVASFFAVALANAGIEGGAMLRAMVFLVIAVTVLVQGLSGGFVAGWLGVRRPSNAGYAVLGANKLGRALGRALREGGEEVLFIDSNGDAVQAAQEEGFRVVFGNALEERTLLRAQLDTMAGCIALTPNEQVNLLFVSRVHEEIKGPQLFVALHLRDSHVTPEMVHHETAHVLFGTKRDIDLWSIRLQRGTAVQERWRFEGESGVFYETEGKLTAGENELLPLVLYRKEKGVPVDDQVKLAAGDEVSFIVFQDRRDVALEWLAANRWVPVETPAEAATEASSPA